MSPADLASIEARLRPIEERWQVAIDWTGQHAVLISIADGRHSSLRVTREAELAGPHDVQFIAHAPEDVRRLLDHVADQQHCTLEQLAAIRARVESASRPPWRAFLKSKGGVGGDSVIWVSDAGDDPDLYLWIDSEPAPDELYEFVAAAPQDLRDLLDETQ